MTSLAKSSRVLFFIAIVMGPFMVGIDFLAIGVAVDPMARELNIGISTIQWFLSAFAIGESCFMVAAGKLCDVYGGRKVMSVGMVFFILSSSLIAISSQPWLIIVGRTFQGISAGFMITASVAAVMHFIPESKRTTWMAFVIGVSASGMVLGPLVGGYLIALESWRLVFLINLPIGLVGLIFIHYAIPQHPEKHRMKRKIDIGGILLLGAALFSLNLLLSRGYDWGWLSVKSFIDLILMFVFLVMFVLHEKRFVNPIVEFAMFRVKNFLAANLVGFLLYFALISWVLIYGIYMQLVMDYTPVQAGEMFVPFGLMIVVIAPFAGKIAAKTGVRNIILIALAMATGGFFFMAQLPVMPSPFLLGVAFMMFGFGFVFVNATSVTAAMAFLTDAKMGIGSGKSMMMRWLGGAVGASVITTVYIATAFIKVAQLVPHYPKLNNLRAIELLKQLVSNQHPEDAKSIVGSNTADVTHVLNVSMHYGLQSSLWTLMGVCALAFLITLFGVHKKRA